MGRLEEPIRHSCLHHVRRIDLGVTVVLDMAMEHEGNQGSLQLGPGPFEQIESGAAQLGSPGEIDDVQRFAQVPVSLGLEVEAAGLSPGPRCHVVFRGLADRNAGVRDIGNPEESVLELLLDGRGFRLDSFHAVANLAQVQGRFIRCRTCLFSAFSLPGPEFLAFLLVMRPQ